MTRDELEKKIISIKKRGLPVIVEESLIKDTRKEFYETFFRKKLKNISERFVSNVIYLSKLHGTKFHTSKIYNTMGVFLNHKVFSDALEGKTSINNFFVPMVIAEFYGLPVELLLFYDLPAHESTLKEKYPALFRQSRD